jgi:serine/threonine protein kinase/tetratricopeptide (TPR) repeat protein
MNSTKPDEVAIFNVARLIPFPEVRRSYLDQSCAGDEGIRERVEILLRAYDLDPDFLEAPATGLKAGRDSNIGEGPGTRIGPYKLLEPIGEGGFGVVFMAQQDQPVRRMVALKIVKPGMDTKQVIARFESERQSLALMSHPNIAQIIDGGETASGRPYFVMELVRGMPITDYCDKNHLPAEDRLKLFVSVCQAIQHAHQKGIIHRDIKPSNVMVTLAGETPVVKIIDFGVAKATAQQLTEKTLFTGYGQMVGTPAYMSPEQASMSLFDVDTRSDVYSLGVLLYELLTGTTPIESARLREAGFVEIQRLICEEEPTRPSTRLSALGDSATFVADNRATDPKHLRRMLAGDLDWIVMKALEKDRNRRYATPERFAEDIERYLRREPVMARPPSAAYRLAKFAERHRGSVVAAAAVALALLAGTAIAVWQAVVATRAKHHALVAALAESDARGAAVAKEAETQAILSFLEDRILAAARPRGRDGGLGPDVSLRAAIDAAVPAVEKGFKDQPLTEARLRITLARSYLLSGDGKAAAAQFEPARAILTKVLGPDHPDTIESIIGLGFGYFLQGRIRESVNLYEEILPICKAKFGPDASQTLQCMNNLALGLHQLEQFEESIRIHQEVLALSESRYGADAPSTLRSMSNLANVYHAVVRYDQALKLREKAVELLNARYGRDDVSTLNAMNNLADSYFVLGRYGDALRLHKETLSRRKNVLGVDHPDTLTSLWAVAKNLVRLHRGADAVPLLDECLERGIGKHVSPFLFQAADLRLQYFAKANNAAECRKTAELWEKQERVDARSVYQAAVCRAVTAAVLAKSTPADARTVSLAGDDADRAMAWLTKAVAAGYNNMLELTTSKDLDILRDRADFKMLMADLEQEQAKDKPRSDL